MGRDSKQFSIDDHTYEVVKLGAREGRKIWLKLVRSVVPAFETLAAEESTSDRALVAALAVLLRGLDDDTVEQLYEAFGATCTVEVRHDDGHVKRPQLKGVIFDDHFAGRYMAMSQWLAECVMYNFLPSLSGQSVGDVIANLRAAGAAKLKPAPQTTSTSSSGAS